ncbi:hypothetical protein [Acinetobacter sp. NCu2D-2]|uniref:hypothetical protein n=1 Tax=Acinetobacter sp. NCu2D-2 TaxID=1608473 RepID=UPI000AB04387|nr:hypothetical protein [Acinetobacter sp. NCu2D-2]
MSSKKPNKVLAPLVIAGITIGFLGAAYKFIFVDSKRTKKDQTEHAVDKPVEDQQN